MTENRNVLWESLRIVAPIVILGAGVGGLLVFGQRPEPKQQKQPDDAAPLVRTAPARLFEGTFDIAIDGVAVPYRHETVSAEVAGRIVEKPKHSRSGNYVNKGDVLFRIDSTDYQFEVDRLEAQLAQSDAEIQAAKVDIKNAQSLVVIAGKQLELWNTEVGRFEKARTLTSVTQADLDEARRQQLTAMNASQSQKNQLESLMEKVKTLTASRKLIEVQLQQARTQFKRTKVTARVAGTVVTDDVEVNKFVKAGDRLIVINDTSQAEVKSHLLVDELYWIWLQSGLFTSSADESSLKQRFQIPPTPVKVVFSFQGIEYEWDGKLSRYEGTGLDEKTRTIPVRVLIPEPTKVSLASLSKQKQNVSPSGAVVIPPSIFTGMFVTVHITIRPPMPLLAIPSEAIRPGEKVWIVRDGKLQIQQVQVARALRDSVLVRQDGGEGLKSGDRVVVSPLPLVKHGMAVKEATDK